MIACYGYAPGFVMTPLIWLQLELNIPRVRKQQAVAVADGLVASGPAPLGREWADAIALDASEVEAIHSEANRQRAMARSVARGNRPFG